MDGITSDVPKEKKRTLSRLWAYRKYINIELLMFFYIMPSMLNAIAMQNFPLEKACRVNYNYSASVCTAILDKDEFGINCDEFDFKNITTLGSGLLWNVTNVSPNFNYTVCRAELDAQKLNSQVFGIRAPIAAIFPFIVILFAGGWSDRYNKRKPCIMFPLIGEGLSFLGLLISAIFYDEISMEFGAYVEVIVPAMFGGFIFIIMAVFSYITAATPEPDRVFRFGVFSILTNSILMIGTPFSGILFKKLGYIYSFAIGFIFELVAFLYVLLFIEEVKPTKKDIAEEQDTENTKFDTSAITEVNEALDEAISNDLDTKKEKSCLVEFFDPTHAIECLKIPFAQRSNYGKPLLIALIIALFLTIGPTGAEGDYWYRYTLVQLNWTGNQYSVYNTFGTAMVILGTIIGTAVFSKILKMSHSAVGILSALCIVISRPMFAFARDSIMFYGAAAIEMFVSLSSIAIKAIGSSIVDEGELSRMYAIFGVSEPIAQFIFPPMYSYVYTNTVDTFPGAIFLFGELFFIPNVIVFIFCYILLKRKVKRDESIEIDETNGVVTNRMEQREEEPLSLTSL